MVSLYKYSMSLIFYYVIIEATAKKNADKGIKYPEAAALKANIKLIADTIQGSFIDLANHLESSDILTLDEKQMFIDPKSRQDVLYTEKMLDEVKKQMKENDEVFNVLIEIMKDKGGPPCTILCNNYKSLLFVSRLYIPYIAVFFFEDNIF